MTVQIDDGRSVQVDLKDYNRIDHGYAATIHKAQGMTVDRTHVLATPGMDAHSSYVALSRHRRRMDLHYGRDDLPMRVGLSAPSRGMMRPARMADGGRSGKRRNGFSWDRNREVRCMIELLNLGPLWLADSFANRIWVRHSARDHFANQLMRCVGFKRSPAIGGKLLKIEHLGLLQ
jgi:hypothetical protein